MESYDPLKKPDPEEWRELGELERIDLVEEYHRRARISLPNIKLHAIIHAVVETQIVESPELQVEDVVNRLIDEGLDRHDAIHAVGNIVAGIMFDMQSDQDAAEDPNMSYVERLKTLTAEEWLKSGE